jgi:hypothetical protein
MMARPRTSLLQRCCEGSFRSRHHWRLLAVEPELPVVVLAELQQRARAAGEEEHRSLACEFDRRLSRLTAEERGVLVEAAAVAEANGSVPEALCRDDADLPVAGFGPLRVRVEAAAAQFLEEAGGEASAAEWLLHDLLTLVAERLDSVRAQLLRDGLMIEGSRGQRRAHPLLVQERDLARELVRRLQEFEATVRKRVMTGRSLSELLDLR